MFQNQSHDELKASLESSIPRLEGYQDTLKEITSKAKEWVNDAENKMRETTDFIRKQFAVLREAIDKKEEEILQSLEMNEVEQEDTNKLIYNARGLMCEIPTIIESVKALLNGWNTKKEEVVAVDTIEEVLSIKEKVKSGEEIVKKLKTFESCETFVDTERFIRGMKRGLVEINCIEKIPTKRVLHSAITGLKVDKVHSMYVSLHWDKGKQFDEYIISYREEGGDWSDEDKLIHVDKKNDHCVIYPLKSDTRYQFRVMGKTDGMETIWSEVVPAKTERRYVIPEVESVVRELRNNLDDAGECARVLNNVIFISGRGNDTVRKAFGEAGIIDVIINVMKTHTNNIVICGFGCVTLGSISLNSDNQIIAGECGAIDVVLNVIKTHINNVDVCGSGCCALCNITINDDNKVKAGERGTIDVVLNVMRTHINDADVCEWGCRAFINITFIADSKVKAGQCGAIDVILDVLKTHINNDGVCKCGCCVLKNITINNADNKVKAGQCGAIDVILNVMRTHINDADACKFGCDAFMDITINADNQVKARQYGAIDTILNAMKIHISNAGVCYRGCRALWNISEGSYSIQKESCEKGGLTTLIQILRKYSNDDNNIDLLESCCSAIGVILSSQGIHSEFCKQDVLDAARECYEKHKDSEQIRQFFLGLTMEEDPRVRDAVSKDVCTRDVFPKCKDDCMCDENIYCHKCCVQQKAFKCHTCDKGKVVFYCEVCWKKHHQGHECEEFFYPVRCATK